MQEVVAIYIQTGVAAAVGLLAWAVYTAQKRDRKRDAANSILLEIQGGESAITKVKDAIQKEHLDIDVSVLPMESWSANKHLFVRDFDQDEWASITDFYNKAALIDDAIRYNKTAFANDVEQIRTNRQRVLAKYAEDVIQAVEDDAKENDGAVQLNTQELETTYDSKAKAFERLYMNKQGEFLYKPQKPINDVKLYLTDFPKLTTSSIGIKLKKIAKLK